MIEARSLHRILRGTSETLSVVFYSDGSAANPTGVTVTITRADGTAIATDAATGGDEAKRRTYALTPSDTADLDILTAVWSGTLGGETQTVTTYAEIVGAHLFTVAQARSFGRGDLRDTAQYPADYIESVRARITDTFEDICGVSFIPRYKLVTLDGTDLDTLFLPDFKITAVRSVATRASGGVTWTAYDAAALADLFIGDSGALYRETLGTFTGGRRNVRVGYEYGMSQPPLEISRAALKVLEATAAPSNLPDRARTLTDDLGTFTLASPGYVTNMWSVASYFGIPEVDEVLSRYRYRVPGIA